MEGSKLISKSRSKLRPEGSRGASSAVDVAFLTLMVSLASLLLIDAGLPRDDLGREAYAERLAQDILLFLQRAPTESFGDFSYSPGLRELRAVAEPSAPSEKRIEEETFVQLIAEDVLIDVASGENEDFGEDLECEFVEPEVRRFPDGELYVRAPKDLKGERAAVVQSMPSPQNENLVETLFLLSVARDMDAEEVIAVIPYLAYARQDKRFKPGEAVSVEAVMGLIEAAGGIAF